MIRSFCCLLAMRLLFYAEHGCSDGAHGRVVSGQQERLEVSLLTLPTPAGAFGRGRMVVSGGVGAGRSGSIFGASCSICRRKQCPLRLGSSVKICVSLIISIYFVWALRSLIKCLCICSEKACMESSAEKLHVNPSVDSQYHAPV